MKIPLEYSSVPMAPSHKTAPACKREMSSVGMDVLDLEKCWLIELYRKTREMAITALGGAVLRSVIMQRFPTTYRKSPLCPESTFEAGRGPSSFPHLRSHPCLLRRQCYQYHAQQHAASRPPQQYVLRRPAGDG